MKRPRRQRYVNSNFHDVMKRFIDWVIVSYRSVSNASTSLQTRREKVTLTKARRKKKSHSFLWRVRI